MSKLSDARRTADLSEQKWKTTLARYYPGMDVWTWYKAHDAVSNGDATADQKKAAENDEINAAHDQYIRDLHAFYLLRDGPKGFLGKYGV